MAVKKNKIKEDVVENVSVSLDQVLAAIVHARGPIAIPFSDMIADYSGKEISISIDDQVVIFDLVVAD